MQSDKSNKGQFQKGHKPEYTGRKEIQWTLNENGCHICISHSKDHEGYAKQNVKGQTRLIHRYIYEQKYGEIPNGLCVCHKCDTPACINPDHLFLGTYKDNNQNRAVKGRSFIPNGENNPNHKLTKEHIIKIRRDNRKYKEIAEVGI